MHRWTTLFSLLVLIALSAGSVAAQTPDPTEDLEEEFMGCRPGPCDIIDYQFGVKNNSTTHDYIISITGTPIVADDEESDGVKDCCDIENCDNEFTGEEQILLAGECETGHKTESKGFPDCLPLTCECDFNGDCDDHPWCATIKDAMVVVTQWRTVYEEDWHEYAEPIVLCDGKGQGGQGGAPPCQVVNWCAGQIPGPCYLYTLCND